MDEYFQQHETKRLAAAQVQDRADFTAELNGSDNGRVKRFGLDAKHQQDKIRKEREKETLAQALRINAAYVKLYNDTLQNLHNATSAVYEAQLLAAMELDQAQELLRQTVDLASIKPDGTAVFLCADGAAYDLHGQKLDAEALAGVIWRKNAPSWETFQERQSHVQDKQDRFDLMNAHEIRLGELQAIMEDKDNPPSMDELQAVNEEISNIKTDADKILSKPLESKIQQSAPNTLPNLDFGALTR